MASGPELVNPNEIPMNDDSQVMSRPNATQAQSDRVSGASEPVRVNGVPAPTPPPMNMNMDGETAPGILPSAISTGEAGFGHTGTVRGHVSGGDVSTDPIGNDVPSSSTASARGFLLGPESGSDLGVSAPVATPTPLQGVRRGSPGFLSGVAKAIQSIPAAVEGLVMGHQPSTHRVPGTDADGYVSAQSGSPDQRRPPPPAAQVPGTPLLDERTLRTLTGHQAAAPHLYAPEAPASGGKPPSATSSDIQAEVRRQLQEIMILRDEENAALRSRVELLASENQVLRQEIAGHVYSSEAIVRSEGQGGFPGFGWFGRGIGNLMSGVTSPKPTSPGSRLMALRPPPPPKAPLPSTGFESSVPIGGAPDYGAIPRPDPPAACGISSGPEGSSALDLSGVQRSLNFDTSAEAPTPLPERLQVSFPRPPDVPEVPLDNASQDPLNVVLTGMAQLQGVVAGLAASPKAIPKQETIKPGVPNLPDLPSPGPEACLQFADWLHASKPALFDVSDSSEEFWDKILKESGEWYAHHIKLDPISRLTDRPKPSDDVSNPRWARVSRRMETMVLAAAPAVARDEISAARVTGLLAVVASALCDILPRRFG